MTPLRFGRRCAVALLMLVIWPTLALPARACLNHYGRRNIHGEAVTPGAPRENYRYFIDRLSDHSEHAEIVARPAPTEPAAGADYKVRNDYAVILIRRGDARKAAAILESIEKDQPGEYIVAANLGTAYELSGHLEKAHQWIQEGIRRNPQSHEGSEWLHLKILEARKSLSTDPEWAKSHRVLDLDFGNAALPRKPTSWPKDSGEAEGVIRALTYQLSERLAFVPPPDTLVAGMIADLADLLAIYRSVDHAIGVYELALRYGPVGRDVVTARLASALEIRRQEAETLRSGEASRQRWWTVVAVSALGIALLLWIRKRAIAA